MNKPLFFILAAITLSFPAHATENNEAAKSRINELIPDTWVEYPAIEPAIPTDFVMLPGKEEGNILWGTKRDLDNMEKYDPSALSNGVFVLRHSMEHQTGPDTFSFTKQDLIKEFNKAGLQVMRAGLGHWGDYPIFFYEGVSPEKEVIRSVWVGLNSPEKTVLIISMIPTANQMNDERQWNRFLNHTKQLKGYEYFRAIGSDMKKGCTTYTCSMGVVEAKAQQRKKDNKIVVNVTPLNKFTTFQINKTVQASMRDPWNHGANITKIYGTMVYEDGNHKNVINTVINVLNEEVTNFTIQSN